MEQPTEMWRYLDQTSDDTLSRAEETRRRPADSWRSPTEAFIGLGGLQRPNEACRYMKQTFRDLERPVVTWNTPSKI